MVEGNRSIAVKVSSLCLGIDKRTPSIELELDPNALLPSGTTLIATILGHILDRSRGLRGAEVPSAACRRMVNATITKAGLETVLLQQPVHLSTSNDRPTVLILSWRHPSPQNPNLSTCGLEPPLVSKSLTTHAGQFPLTAAFPPDIRGGS